MFLDWKCFCHA